MSSKIADTLRGLPPDLKRAVKAALEALRENPDIGERLRDDLARYSKYRVGRFRLIYLIHREARMVKLIAVGHRSTVYDEASDLLRRAPDLQERLARWAVLPIAPRRTSWRLVPSHA